jgi:F-type H+-transporting ATPase subunit delta
MITREAASAPAVAGELDAFLGAAGSDPEFRDVLTRPWIKPVDRRGIAVALAKKVGCGKLVQDFVGLVGERGRMDHLGEITEAYRALVDDELGQARARVRSAVALTEEEKRQLGARLERALGKRILVEEHVDSTLLGGFVAQVGSLILDGSLDGQLARMRERLARG